MKAENTMLGARRVRATRVVQVKSIQRWSYRLQAYLVDGWGMAVLENYQRTKPKPLSERSRFGLRLGRVSLSFPPSCCASSPSGVATNLGVRLWW